jgi:formyltetrahydrofolate synthetase
MIKENEKQKMLEKIEDLQKSVSTWTACSESYNKGAHNGLELAKLAIDSNIKLNFK